MKKICIVTGTRAEYGLLKPLIDRVYNSDKFELQLAVTGMHLSSEFGLTYQEIEKDGYPITSKIEMLLSSDTPVGITKSMGLAMIGFADYFATYQPDIVVILGDRYEMLMAASAAMIARIPIAHIHGGELTEGVIDEAIRHSITKMSQLHFVTTETYRKRVIQLGEQPEMVFNVGALGVENIKQICLLERKQLEEDIHFTFSDKTVMVTFHPVTLEQMTAEKQFNNLLLVIENHKELKVIFTKANSDTDGRVINRMIDKFVENNKDRCVAFTSLGQLRYLSSLRFCCAVMGNSSSGIIEVPSFGIPTVNIGDRQKGRVRALSVIDCGNTEREIENAVVQALSGEFRDSIADVKNPYEGENTSEKILQIIGEKLQQGIDIKKSFYNFNEA
jgi:GDP/UDP-N,N'-diacetylbacillosamine 2-epimerase (hydrolysing)